MPFKNPDERRNWYATHPEQQVRRAARQQAKRAAKRTYIWAIKDRPCADCKQTYPPYVMDFDHRDPSTKRFTIAHAVDDNVSWRSLEDEIAKCDIVCANCHRIRTWGQQRAADLPCKKVD